MATVWLLLRADLRQRWRALLGLALILGLVGGVVITAAAGARRTETAYPRLLGWANAAQVDLIPQGTGMTATGTASSGFYADLRKLPQVAAMDTGALYEMVVPGSASRAPGDNQGIPVQAWASPDATMGVTADRVKVLSGALFNPAAPGQAMVDQRLAALEHLKPGGTLRLTGVIDGGTGGARQHRELPLTFTVTAVVAFDTAIVPSGQYGTEPTVLLSAPFTRTAPAHLSYGDEAAVRLRPGASMKAFLKAANTLAGRYAGTGSQPGTGGQLNVVSLADQVAATNRAIRPQVIALAALAGLAGLIAFAVLGQLLSRQLAMDAVEYPVLRAVGATRLPLLALSLARLAVVTVGGAVIAVAIAVAASPLMPIGPARLAEPAPGMEVNLAMLAAGAAVIALAPLAALVPAAWRSAGQAGGPLGVAEPGQAHAPGRASRLGPALGLAGSVSGSVGVRMAFQPGRGRSAVPVRSALAGSAIATAALAAAAVFGASLITLVSTPHAYGQNWDQVVDLGFGNVPGTIGTEIAAKVPVAQYAAGSYGQLTINGQGVAAIGLDPLRGAGYLTLLAGRAPRSPSEIALGAATMRALNAHLGDSVHVTVHLVTDGSTDTSHVMRVVGEVVLPAFSRGTFAPTGLGTGAVVTDAVVSAPGNADTGCTGKQTCYNFFLLRYRPGADRTSAGQAIMSALLASGCPIASCAAFGDQRPDGIKSYASIRDTPFVLGALLAVLAVGTFAHVLRTGVRRRGRDLAMLKTLGFTRAQVLRVVAWQATAFAAVALLIGVPLGVVAGNWAWSAFASSVGVAARSTVPLWLILLAIPVTLLLANVIAAFPGVAAARLRPAAALHTE